MDADRAVLAHLLRRAGFGPTAAEVDRATAMGYDATVDLLLDFSAPDPADLDVAPNASSDLTTVERWWLRRMAKTAHPLREKLTWFWHGHFATSFDKVGRADLMYRQNQLFRSHAAGNFETLAQAVAKDPAMMIWLDTITNRAAHPNENFARELMELFTMGLGSYSERDVREAARAFTGWTINQSTGNWALDDKHHDFGQKTVLGVTGNLGGEDVVHLVATHPTGERFVISRLWSRFAYPVHPNHRVVDDLHPGYAADHDISHLMRAIFLHPEFVSSTARTGLVKQPIEWAVGAVRALGAAADTTTIVGGLGGMNQVPFRPPSVAGWPANLAWLSTAATLARVATAQAEVAKANVSNVTSADAAARLLSTTWSAPTARSLDRLAGNPGELVTLALVAPETVLA